jgi:ABC-type sulfate/molybdate transport systems ATPase subunit
VRIHITHPRITARLSAEPGEIVALVGPNGAGKTSLLRALVGLLPATGSVELAGRDVSRLPVHQRRIGWVPQEPSLFAHLSARDNVAYPLRTQGHGRVAARSQAQAWLDRLDVGELGQRRPASLSGGQLARVALARALAGEPDLLLLDEPLAALDAETRDDVRRLLRRTLAGGRAPVLVVTHDPIDVVALADSMVVLEQGAVVQQGTPAEVAAAPRSTWVASLLGQNAWQGTTDATGLQVSDGHISAAEPLAAGLPALALCQPSAVTLHREPPVGSARTVLAGAVGDLRSFGGRVRVSVLSEPPITAEITVAAAVDLHLAEGGQVWAALKATEVTLVAL